MIWALHGFGGSPRDWDFLGDVRAPDLARDFSIGSLDDFGRELAARIAAEDPAPVLMGYSMGARLALQTLLARPKLFRAAVLVAPHLGLANAQASQRVDADELWAQRILREDDFWPAWNAQTVFATSGAPPARNRDFDRARLAAVMRNWSLGRQSPLGARLFEIGCPLLWAVGEKDVKFRAQAAKGVALSARAKLWVAPGAGHRVLTDAPAAFKVRVRQFLSEAFGAMKGTHVGMSKDL